MRARNSLVVLLIYFSGCFSLAQSHALPPPVNGISFSEVIRLSQAGLSDDTIIAQIKRRPSPFSLSLDQVLQLKDAHVSNAVIEAMMRSGDHPANEAQAPTQSRQAVMTAAEPTANTPPKTVQPTTEDSSPITHTQLSRLNDGKKRLYVTDRPITEVISMIKGGSEGTAQASGFGNSFSASAQQASYIGGIKNDNRGGADPRTLEVSGDILDDCHIPNLTITNNPMVADYVLDFRRQGGKRSTFFVFGGLTGLAISSNMKVDHAALYAANGDLVSVAKARTVGGAVKEICSRFRQ